MKIKLTTIEDKEYEPENITQITFIQSAGVACDCFCAVFKSRSFCGEIVSVRVFDNDTLIFNGYCDNQRITVDKDGFEIFFYARSTAAVLVDNEALPFTYNKPTAKQLCFTFAEPFGFICDLPIVKSDEQYEVEKGVTCYGAISNFVAMTAGAKIYITPKNCIKLLTESRDIKNLNCYTILSSKAVINRSEPLSQICFKKTSSSPYNLHTMAQVQGEFGLNERRRYVNLSSLEPWQREKAILQRLKNSYEDYKMLEITVFGYVTDRLYQRFSYNSDIGCFDDYILTEKKYTCDEKGRYTRMILKKKIDIKEITYVD